MSGIASQAAEAAGFHGMTIADSVGGEGDVADRREGAVPEAAVLVAVGEGSAAGAYDAAARSGQNMVAGRRIPFHGRAAAYIDIGLA